MLVPRDGWSWGEKNGVLQSQEWEGRNGFEVMGCCSSRGVSVPRDSRHKGVEALCRRETDRAELRRAAQWDVLRRAWGRRKCEADCGWRSGEFEEFMRDRANGDAPLQYKIKT